MPEPTPGAEGAEAVEVRAAWGAVVMGGEAFRLRKKIPGRPFMKFAKLVSSGMTDSNQLEALAAMYDLLKGVLEREEWKRFETFDDEYGASSEELMTMCQEAYGQLGDRPTQPPSDSSGGRTSTRVTSEAASSQRAKLVGAGRPDLALVHELAEEARTG